MAGWRGGIGMAAAALVLGPVSAPAQTADDPAAANPLFFERLFGGTGRDPAPVPATEGSNDAPAVDPAPPPSLARAEWIGFTPVLAAGTFQGAGAWIASPFPKAGTTGWVTDTVSGLTVQVRLVWREAVPGSLAQLSAEAAAGLGLAPGAVANVAIYVAR